MAVFAIRPMGWAGLTIRVGVRGMCFHRRQTGYFRFQMQRRVLFVTVLKMWLKRGGTRGRYLKTSRLLEQEKQGPLKMPMVLSMVGLLLMLLMKNRVLL